MTARVWPVPGKRDRTTPLRVFELNRRVSEVMEARVTYAEELAEYLKMPAKRMKAITEYDVLHGYMKMTDREFAQIAKALMIQEREFFIHRTAWRHLLERILWIRPFGQPINNIIVPGLGLRPRP